ncbi:membrane protein-like protein [Alkaliphilus oremlandii OhILAs]|uniref:Membrane protein-like protein n=2 Tax=Alkaliphilus oremlandii TaxID=461876 RepID=A8MH19_ALKOO|nr:membrane protein-like protein [Alkaliphilus oremlandii OhILAs]
MGEYNVKEGVDPMRKLLKIVFVVMFICIVVLETSIISNAEESIHITNWLLASNILENGDLTVVEDITFNFQGQYNGVFREIILENTSGVEGIKIVEISEGKVLEYKNVKKARKGDGDVFVIKEEKDKILLQIFSPSKNQEKTFRLIYTVKNVAKKYKDIGEFYYKFLGKENTTPIDFFSAKITLPQRDSRNEVKIFAHGPLNGQVHKVSEDRIHLTVENVPKTTYIEGRILFPKEFIPLSNNTVDRDGYTSIIAEESGLQKKIEENKVKREARSLLFGNISVTVAVIEVLIGIFLIVKTRRVSDLRDEEKYEDIPEDCTPAIANYITGSAISSNTIIATMLDLYRKGYIKIENGDELTKKKEVLREFTILKVKEEDGNLKAHERYFIKWLIHEIGNGKSVTTKEIENYSKSNSVTFTKNYYEWQRQIKEDALNQGYFDKSTAKYGVPLIILFPIGIVLAIIALVYENLLGLTLMLTSILMLLQGIVLLSRRSDYGYLQYRRWGAFKNHMKKLKNNHDIKAADKYPKDMSLIYGLAFGIDGSILNKLNIETNGPDHTALYGGWIYWYFILNNNRNNAFNQSINNSFSGGTTTVGGGGSFTAGGGGGAGGGGAGGF